MDGAGFEIHKVIGNLPKPKRGWVLPGHHFTGPFYNLEKQLSYDPETGGNLGIYQQPTGSTDAVAMQHDVDYSVCSHKKQKYGEDEKIYTQGGQKMVKALDAVPWK